MSFKPTTSATTGSGWTNQANAYDTGTDGDISTSAHCSLTHSATVGSTTSFTTWSGLSGSTPNILNVKFSTTITDTDLSGASFQLLYSTNGGSSFSALTASILVGNALNDGAIHTASISVTGVTVSQIQVKAQCIAQGDGVAGSTVVCDIFDIWVTVTATGPATPSGVTALFAVHNPAAVTQPSGYMFRFDGRSGQPRASILRVDAGGWTSFLDTPLVANNAAALPRGWYRMRVEYFLSGRMNVYCNNVWCMSAQDTTYKPGGALLMGGELAATSNVVVAPGSGMLTSLDKGFSWRSSPLIGQGSIATISQDTLSFASTSTSITWSWTAFSIFAPDGTVFSIASGSFPAFTGLTPSTTYHFYFYVNLASGTVTVAKSSVSSGTAAETRQVLIQVAQADGFVCIRPDGTAATPASGSGSGSGGGGSSGCFTGDVEIKTPGGFKPFASLPHDSPFEIVNETGTHRATLVVHDGYVGFMLPLGRDRRRLVTPDHLMKNGNDWVSAEQKYSKGVRLLFKGTVYNLHVLSDDPDDHHYILFNGDVAHNLKIL